MRKIAERNTAIILFFVGVLVLGGGIYLFVEKLKFLDRSTVAEGVVGVVGELESSSSSKNGRTYYPVVTYRDSKGQNQSFTSQIGSSPASYDSEKFFFDPTPFLNNRLVEVWIDPQNPKKRYYLDVSFLPVEA